MIASLENILDVNIKMAPPQPFSKWFWDFKSHDKT